MPISVGRIVGVGGTNKGRAVEGLIRLICTREYLGVAKMDT